MPKEKNINGFVEKLLLHKLLNNTRDITEVDNEIVSKIEDSLKGDKLNSAVILFIPPYFQKTKYRFRQSFTIFFNI